jgi:3'-phosphoadenosine 5'-phosphosulfate (PAPS) 3'-phosphatase
MASCRAGDIKRFLKNITELNDIKKQRDKGLVKNMGPEDVLEIFFFLMYDLTSVPDSLKMALLLKGTVKCFQKEQSTAIWLKKVAGQGI